MPWYAKVFAACVAGYAFSPINLTPDFVPVLGDPDDVLLVPLGVALALKLIPLSVMAECRVAAAAMDRGKSTNWIADGVIVAVWLGLAALSALLMARALR